jgi:hypothetical protein
MSDYSIHVENGKVIGNSVFYRIANDLLGKECRRLCDFTDALDKDPAEKKKRIAEYKCAKYRYAAVSTPHALIQMNNFHRQKYRLEYSHFLLLHFEELLKERADYLALCDSAPQDEKPDYSLYYAMLALVEKEIGLLEEKLPLATDWERVELEERLDGWRFGKACLDEAWAKRKDELP